MTVDGIEARLLAIMAKDYAVEMEGGDSFVAILGLDSLEVVEFVLELEAEWPQIEDKIKFDNEVLLGSVRELAQTIHRFVGAPQC